MVALPRSCIARTAVKTWIRFTFQAVLFLKNFFSTGTTSSHEILKGDLNTNVRTDMASDSVVRARIDTDTKDRATEALASMGLSVSDAIRLLLVRVAADGAFPFAVKEPNATTRKAMAELERGKDKRFESADAMFKDLGI